MIAAYDDKGGRFKRLISFRRVCRCTFRERASWESVILRFDNVASRRTSGSILMDGLPGLPVLMIVMN